MRVHVSHAIGARHETQVSLVVTKSHETKCGPRKRLLVQCVSSISAEFPKSLITYQAVLRLALFFMRSFARASLGRYANVSNRTGSHAEPGYCCGAY
jgi:hypothetical protein